MKTFLQIKIYNGKGLFENVLISKNVQTGEQQYFHNYSYLLSSNAKNELKDNKVLESNLLSITLPLREAKKVLKEMFIDYKDLVEQK